MRRSTVIRPPRLPKRLPPLNANNEPITDRWRKIGAGFTDVSVEILLCNHVGRSPDLYAGRGVRLVPFWACDVALQRKPNL